VSTLNGAREFDPYSRRHRKELDDVIDIRLRSQWFENYEINKHLIKKWGDITHVPIIEKAIIVGAGWSLDWNIHLLEGCKTPVISTDKSLKRVMKYVKPFAVCALNTGETDIAEWLDIGETDIWLIAPVTAHPDTFKNWKGPMAFVNPQNTCPDLVSLVQAETGIIPTMRGCNAGYFSLITAFTLNAKMTAMLGMNYCYKTEKEALSATCDDHCVKMRDINGKFVFTALDWLDARREMLNFCLDIADEMRVVNCSEGGIIYEQGVIDAMTFDLWRQYDGP